MKKNTIKNNKLLMIALSSILLTACSGGGGGGGGGGSSVPSDPNVVQVDSDNSTLYLTDRTTQVEVRGEIDGESNGFVGISATNSLVLNNAIIEIDGSNSIGIKGNNSTIKNNALIDVDGLGSIGIKGENNSTIINEAGGRLSLDENTTGIYVTGGSTTINKGIIYYDVTNDYVVPNSKVTGIYLNGGSTGENYGTISLINTALNNIQFVGVEATEGSTFTNKNGGRIEVSSTPTAQSIGMKITGTGSKGVNEGYIKITGSKGIGMYASNGASIVNESTGVIDLRGATNSIGMYGTGAGTTVQNKGTIYLNWDSQNDVIGNDNTATDLASGNVGIKVENGAQLVNNGVMISQSSFDTNDLTNNGSGQFVMGDGGTLQANSVSGLIYVNSDIVNGYDSVGVEENAIVTQEMNGGVASNSAMYSASYKKNEANNSYDLVMERISFQEILKDSDKGTMLENSYYSNGNQSKDDIFNEYRKAQTNAELERLVVNSLGEDIFPIVQKITYDIKNSSNENFVNAISNSSLLNEENSDLRYIAGGNISTMSRGSQGVADDYDTTISNVHLGIDKYINSKYRIGFVATIGNANADFSHSSELESDFYQGNIYGIYENNGVEYLFSPYIGVTKGDLDREINIGDINSTAKSDADSEYFGILGQISKKYSFKLNEMDFYAKPKIFIDGSVVILDEIDEDNSYGAGTNKNRTTSFVTGLGSSFGKEFFLKDNYKIDTALNAMYNHEFGNPDSSLTGNANAFDGTVQYDEYSTERDYGDIGAKIQLEKLGFLAYLEYKYIIAQEDEMRLTLGASYKF